MTDTLVPALLSTTYSLTSAHRRVRLLRHYLESKKYTEHSTSTLASHLKDQGATESDIKAISTLDDSVLKSFKKETLGTLFDSVQEALDACPVVVIFAPVKMDEAGEIGIGTWCRKNIDTHLLVDLRYEPHLSVGCAVAYKGVYGNFSLSYFLRNKMDKVIDVLASYDDKTSH